MINTQPSVRGFQSWLDDTEQGFDYSEIEGLGLYSINSFTRSGLVRHCFTSRKGGASVGSYAGLNMSWTRTESEEITRRNYELAAYALGIDPSSMVVVDGDHGTAIKRVDETHRGMGLYTSWQDAGKFDGMTTAKPGIALCTIHGDCTPIFVLDPVKKTICMSHSGWRGTVSGMPGQSVKIMAELYGSRLEDLLVGIGPCIGGCCFEVGADVANQFKHAFPNAGCVVEGSWKPGQGNAPGNGGAPETGKIDEEKPRVDIMRAAAWQLYEAGIPAANVTIAHMCTCCDDKHFHSFRRDGKLGGSMASILQLI